MNLWLFSLRNLYRRPGRSLLTLLSIVLGVGTVFAVGVTTRSARSAFERLTETMTGKADAEVMALGGGRFARDLTLSLENSPEIQCAVPLLRQIAILTAGKKRLQITVVGTVLAKEKILRPFDVVAGRVPENEGEMLLEDSLAQSAGIQAGDSIKLLTRRGLQSLNVVGLIRPTDMGASMQGGLAYLDLEEWQWLCKAEQKIDALQIALIPGAARDKVLDSLASQLPKELQLRPAHAPNTNANVTLIAFEHGLDISQALALGVAALLILNTFMMNVAERRGEIAVLRLIGSTRGQIMRLLLREGAAVGLAGALLGIPVGWLLGQGLAGAMESAFGVTLQNQQMSLGPLIFVLALGPLVTMVAAYLPARRAGRVAPLEVLRQRTTGRSQWLGSGTIALGIVLLALSSGGLALAWARRLPTHLAVPVALLFLTALLLTFPLALRPGCAAIYRLLRFCGPVEFDLTYRQMLRTEGRSRLTWGILFLSMAASVGTGLILTDIINDLRGDVPRTMQADFIVRVSMPNMSTGKAVGLPEDVPGLVGELKGVDSQERVAVIGMETQANGPVVAMIREFDRLDRPPLLLDNADSMEIRRKILAGAIAVSDILAYKLQLQVGDSVTLQYAGRTRTFPIAATGPFFFAGGSVLFMDRHVAEKEFGPVGAEALLITAQARQHEALAGRLREICWDRGLLLQSYAELQASIDGILNTVVACLWVLLALGFLIAVFGVTNTLMMNVLEQTREIGLMRVLGMQRRQVRKMILAQSAYIGILALVPGLLAGVLLAYVVRSSTLAILGENPHFGAILPWLAPYAGLLLLLVLLFGWLPAARAARLHMLEAIRTE